MYVSFIAHKEAGSKTLYEMEVMLMSTKRKILKYTLQSVACWSSAGHGMPLKVENRYCCPQECGGRSSRGPEPWMQRKKC